MFMLNSLRVCFTLFTLLSACTTEGGLSGSLSCLALGKIVRHLLLEPSTRGGRQSSASYNLSGGLVRFLPGTVVLGPGA